MANKKEETTKMVRVNIKDIDRLKDIKHDFRVDTLGMAIEELIKFYKRNVR